MKKTFFQDLNIFCILSCNIKPLDARKILLKITKNSQKSLKIS